MHELGCIETLARVDTLCVDKTGTVTENKMIVEDVCPLCDDRFTLEDIRMIMADYVYAMQADNDTMAALRRYFTGEKTQDATATLPFSSAKKYGGVSFHAEETYLLGAPDVLLAGRENPYQEQIEGYSAKGCRVLLLALYDGSLDDEKPDKPIMPLALILLIMLPCTVFITTRARLGLNRASQETRVKMGEINANVSNNMDLSALSDDELITYNTLLDKIRNSAKNGKEQ